MNMIGKLRHRGSALILAIFIVALLAAVVMGMLQINTEEIQVMQNQIYAVDALAIAEAGLNDAFSEIRADSSWNAGFMDKAFNDGSYTVTVGGISPSLTIISTGTSSQGFVGRVEAEIAVGADFPHLIRVDSLRFNNN